jgi:hypothetical protein
MLLRTEESIAIYFSGFAGEGDGPVKKTLFTAIFVSIIGLAAWAQTPGMPQPFSADMKMSPGTGQERGQAMQGKMYSDSGKMRMEMNHSGHNVIMIINGKTQTSYMLMPEQHMYMEMHANGARRGQMGRMPSFNQFLNGSPCSVEKNMTCKDMGAETVDGRATEHWQITNNGEVSNAWVDNKLHFPIKNVDAQGGTWELTNIKEGAQDASLFEVPSGYQKMDMGGTTGMGGHGPDEQ